ncbi:hypothetical protein [Clostridium sp.]|jgi:hypothetical protein|uniref:hypothetical protein n=1 Tax=Clostridium sp. TaxID=1506 RepID=UPI003EEFF29E
MRLVSEIKLVLDHLYGFNIMSKSKKRKYSYARKTFAVLASNYGHTNGIIAESYSQLTHDIVIYGHKTFNNIKKIDLENYNKCIDRLSLDVKKIDNLKSLSDNEEADEMHKVLKGLGRRDLMYFKSKVFKPFIKKLELEASIQEMK